MNTITKLICAALIFCAGRTVFAQTQNQLVDEVRQRQALAQAAGHLVATNNLQEFYPGETEDLGPQPVVLRAPRYQPITASADEQWYYTDNMFLNQKKKGVDVLVSTLMVAVDPKPMDFLGGQLDPQLGYQHQWFSYNLASDKTIGALDPVALTTNQINLNKLDFNVSTIYANAAWRSHEWQANAGFNYLRLLDSQNYQEFYHELTPTWALRREFKLNETQSLAISYEGDYRFTDTSSFPGPGGKEYNDRTDHSLVVVGAWQLCSHAILQPSYRFQYTHYLALRRDDYLNAFTLTLYVPINQTIALRAFVSYNVLRTDGAFASDYESLNAGGGLNLNVRF